MRNIALDTEVLSRLQCCQQVPFDTIDRLRSLGVGLVVDLPQIIVVGDQSSGKSSVLQAISRVRFPIKEGLCTRFATEVVLRRLPQVKVDVKVIPASRSGHGRAQPFEESSFSKDELPHTIERAMEYMGLDGTNNFSEDVLRVEISAPDVPHLTLVDLPGFYHSDSQAQSLSGKVVVDRLVAKFMSQKGSLILAVISAKNEIVMQRVLSETEKHDPRRERTMGIITKPDTLGSGTGDEMSYIDLAKNNESSHRLALG
jgi:hypothetical protein